MAGDVQNSPLHAVCGGSYRGLLGLVMKLGNKSNAVSCQIFGPDRKKRRQTGENYIMRSFIISSYQILLL